jgi:hypothetical protein
MIETAPTTPTLSKEEQAFLMKALWESLQVPSWNRDDLIDLGKLIFAKKSLKEIASQDEKKFARLFPHLVAMVNHLGAKIMEATIAAQAQQAATVASQPVQAPAPSPPPPAMIFDGFPPLPAAPPPAMIAAPRPQAPAPTPAVPTPPAPAAPPVPQATGTIKLVAVTTDDPRAQTYTATSTTPLVQDPAQPTLPAPLAQQKG